MTKQKRELKIADPAADYLELKSEIDAAVKEVLASGDYIRGRAVSEFEQAFAARAGSSHAIGVASGTDALHLILRAAGVGEGDEVILPAHTFTATAMAVLLAGAIPSLADIDPESMNLDPASLDSALTRKTRAVIAVHLYGQPADMDEINKWAAERGLFVIEDACQAHGALYKGRPAGGLAHAAAFSFYPTKNLSAAGDGGMVVTSDPELAEKVRMLANYGARDKDRPEFPGMNSRLDSIQAAILLSKLNKLDEWNQARKRNAGIYREELEDLPGLELPAEKPDREHVYHQFVARVKRGLREKLRSRLAERGIPTLVHYPLPIHLQPAFSFLGRGKGSFPRAEAAAEEVLSLPVHPHLSPRQIKEVAAAIREELAALY